MTVTNFTDYFKEERDIYISNISNCQVSVSFEVGPGHTESFLFTQHPDPVNITRYIPFQAVKSSMDLRKMLNRQPPALKLMSEDEYGDYYQKMAVRNGLPTAAEALDLAEKRQTAARNHQPLPDAPEPVKLHDVIEDGQRLGEKKLVRSLDQTYESEEINARVLHLCLQVHPQLDDQRKMSAQQFISELDTVSGLTLLDWEYIQSHGFYKSVKALARKRVSELVNSSSEEEDETPVTKVAKTTKAKTPKQKSQSVTK